MANVTTRSRAVPIANRLKLINDEFDYSESAMVARYAIHAAVAEAGEKIVSAVEGIGSYDTGRLIASLDALNHAKSNAIEALLLPSAAPRQ